MVVGPITPSDPVVVFDALKADEARKIRSGDALP